MFFQKKVMKWVKSGQNQLSKKAPFMKCYVDAEAGTTTGLYSQIKVAEVKITIKNNGFPQKIKASVQQNALESTFSGAKIKSVKFLK